MSEQYTNEPMLDMFIFESSQLLEQLEQSILSNEKTSCYTEESINEIFRIMHTIKGSSAMMLFNNISILAHSVEDLFYFIRERKPSNVQHSSLSDLVFDAIDFIKNEIEKIKCGNEADGDSEEIIININNFLSELKIDNIIDITLEPIEPKNIEKQKYYIQQDKLKSSDKLKTFKAVIFFEEGCEMENIRAYTIIHNLNEISQQYKYYPEDIIENDDSEQVIRKQGFSIILKTDKSFEEVNEFFMQTVFLRDLELKEVEEEVKKQEDNEEGLIVKNEIKVPVNSKNIVRENNSSSYQTMISVNVDKLDKLMNLVGEMVIAEAMVTENTDLKGLELDNFNKAARQFKKITSEIQDMVMSIRMVSLSNTFHKMHRIVRDMSKKLNKEVVLEIIGEDTEVDKNIIEQISDPLMHIVRNSIDHGLETVDERKLQGKEAAGKVILEAKNAGSDVLIIIKDDGRGLNKEKLIQKAKKNGLLQRPEEDMTEKEIFSLIFLPGFSTNDKVTEFSGRGVGMDVVLRNIETVGGTILIDSIEGEGTTITLKIPLTLAIIDGMNIRVGDSRYTIPITSIKESFKPKQKDIIIDPDSNEMIMVRGQCYPVMRLHKVFDVKTKVTSFSDGIIIMLEDKDKVFCIFADELLGQQQVVIKSLPSYIKNLKKIVGLAGCTLLGDGSISLILDVNGLGQI